MWAFTNRARQAVGLVVLSFELVGLAPANSQPAITPGEPAPIALPDQARRVVPRPIPRTPEGAPSRFARTQLFFGTARPDGVVSDDEFRAFLDREIAPRFPDGLTVLSGDGQFRGSDGVVIRERSYVVILLYPLDSHAASTKRIERIRELYAAQFEQESVLRIDDPFVVWGR